MTSRRWFAFLLTACLGVAASACNDEGNPVDPGGPPGTPAGLTVTSAGRTSLLVDWSDVSGATSYIVERSSGGGGFAVVDTVAASSLVDGGLAEGTSYTYRVSARNSRGTSVASSAISGTPVAGAPINLTGSLTVNRTLSADSIYVLNGTVFVNAGVVLTIQPGTLILGDKTSKGTLVVLSGGRIEAAGTEAAPIVFTSAQDEGQRAPGDWGGVSLNGRGPVNCPGGTCVAEGLTPPVTFGGTDPADDSGTLRYVRIEFAGIEISPDNELNGLTLNGVGSGTEIDFVQVHAGLDDGFEFFGGTVNAKHLVVTGTADDSFDWDTGWIGKGQFWIAQQNAVEADNGIEADNDADNNDLTPRSNPSIFNLTLVGSCQAGSAASDVGMLLREGTAGSVGNAIVTGFSETGLDIDDAATFTQAASGALDVTNSIFFGNTPADFATDDDGFDESSFATTPARSNRVLDPGLVDECNTSAPDFSPAAGSAALTGAGPLPADPFFTSASYVGAVNLGDAWYQGWTAFPAN